jgi:hypothetical protein
MLCSSRTCSGNDEEGYNFSFFFLFFVPQVKAHWQRGWQEFHLHSTGFENPGPFLRSTLQLCDNPFG